VNRVLHILTKENDPLAVEVIRLQREQAAGEIVVVDLTQAPPEYAFLLQKIFDANSVEVW
jgi:hypothetical protein